MGYNLADGIYPRWSVFVKTIRCAADEMKTYFAERQESAARTWSGHLVCSSPDGRQLGVRVCGISTVLLI